MTHAFPRLHTLQGQVGFEASRVEKVAIDAGETLMVCIPFVGTVHVYCHAQSMRTCMETKHVFNVLQMRLAARPLAVGRLRVTGIEYSISNVVRGTQPFEVRTFSRLLENSGQQNGWCGEVGQRLPCPHRSHLHDHDHTQVRGKRLNNNKQQRMNATYASDHRLELDVIPPMPMLAISCAPLPQSMIAGEVCEFDWASFGSRAPSTTPAKHRTKGVYSCSPNPQLCHRCMSCCWSSPMSAATA